MKVCDKNRVRQKIRAAHGDLKGSFTCLGNWYNLFNDQSMKDLKRTLLRQSISDEKTARSEIKQAFEQAERGIRI